METTLPTNPLFETYVKEHNLETLNVQAINAALFELYEMHLKEKANLLNK